MTIDYEQIRKDNIEEYGKGTRHLAFFERLYSDGTHFIFELLQNAEDASAKRIQFALFNDRLEVRHDGRPFNEKDVRGVCGVGESTKEDDFTQIGRFGIGFKSVYAFTKNPVIHCGEDHFEIRNYVRPYSVAPRAVTAPWTTLIIIPFDKDGVTGEIAAAEIGTRLRCLSVRTLLFLASIEEIEYRIEGGQHGTYLRSAQPCDSARMVTVVGEKSGTLQSESEQWLVFEKSIPLVSGESSVDTDGRNIPPVQIAFLLAEQEATKSGKQRSKQGKLATRKRPWADLEIRALGKSPLVVFFPTEKDSRLGFLIQGPYRTTPARDNIPSNDAWNLQLINETAHLLVETVLPSLKQMDLLTVGCFEALPIKTTDFPESGFFHPLANAVKTALLTQELLPAADGTFTDGASAILGRGEDLRGLLGCEQLKLLFDLDHDVKWLSGEITADIAPALRDYLRYTLNVTEVTPESFAPQISAAFLAEQSDSWVASFYGCLLSWEALWRSRRDARGRSSLRESQIIRLEAGDHVPPFNEDGHPNAYLPLKGTSQLPTVKRGIANDKSAKEFLTRLGITEPDIVAEVIEELLPLYHVEDAMPSASEHAEHMKEILAAWSTDSIVKRRRLEEKLRETPFVRYHCRATGIYGYAKPADVYFPEEELLAYFDGSKVAKFIVTSYSKSAWELLTELGVGSIPRCFEVAYGDPPYSHRSTGGERIKNYVIDGLGEYLARIAKEPDEAERTNMSLTLWRYLVAHAESAYNVFQATRHYFYYSNRYQTYDSLLSTQLRQTAWLPIAGGSLAKPPQTSVDQLLEGFEPCPKLLSALRIQPDPSQEVEQERQAKRNLAAQLGIDLEDAEFIRQNRDEFKHFQQSLIQRAAHQEYVEESTSRNRERRRLKLKERRNEAPTKDSVKKLRSVPNYSRSEIDRQSLFAFYHDEDEDVIFCQMCLDPMPFVKRNGEECGECVDLLTKEWASATGYDLKVMTSLKLVLCPVCSEVYRDYIHKDVDRQTVLVQHLSAANDGRFVVCESDVRRDQKDCALHFNQTHLGDIRDCLEFDNGDNAANE